MKLNKDAQEAVSAINPDEMDVVIGWLKGAHKVSVLSGAGISKESGIPTFREAQTGLWAQYDPEKLATAAGFLNDPPLVWRWYDWRRQMLDSVKPNAGHQALAELEQLISEFVVITQNVDGLHTVAGTQNLLELHGSIRRFKCFRHGHPATEEIPLGLTEPPRCYCGSPLRPDVVWFGESLPEDIWKQAVLTAENCQVMLVVGTSGLVQPAASLPITAKRARTRVIEINPTPTPISDIADIYFSGPSGEILPKILEEFKKK